MAFELDWGEVDLHSRLTFQLSMDESGLYQATCKLFGEQPYEVLSSVREDGWLPPRDTLAELQGQSGWSRVLDYDRGDGGFCILELRDAGSEVRWSRTFPPGPVKRPGSLEAIRLRLQGELSERWERAPFREARRDPSRGLSRQLPLLD
ncbi:hypothetical protein DYH09_04995 [bacterium CPR1]|nr:hypothetical protein [bacterium CPR1]